MNGVIDAVDRTTKGMKHSPLRWHLLARTFLDDTLANSAHAYIHAPTGSGKTFLIAWYGSLSDLPGTRLVIVGASEIVRQHRKAMAEQGFIQMTETDYLDRSGNRWIIVTWQAVARNPERYVRDQPLAYLWFDECHQGGSNADNKSYRRIVDALHPAKTVHVSATTNVSSQKLLGERKGHQFIYKLSTAYDDGLLNPVRLIEIETGNKVALRRFEDSIDHISIEDIEEMPLAKLTKYLISRGVDEPKAKSEAMAEIVANRHRAMITIYLSQHLTESAVFFCPSIEAAEAALADFNKRSLVSAAIAHSAVNEAATVIQQFKTGQIHVIFVVGMLQEGFSMDELALAFDCRFHRTLNARRIAAFVQRLGRLTRKARGKRESRYYVAPDLTHHWSRDTEGSLIGAHILASADSLEVNDLEARIPIFRPEPVEIPTDEGPIAGTETPLYEIASVTGYRETGHSVSLADLHNDETCIFMQQMISSCRSGAKRPPHRSRDGKRMNACLTRYPKFAAQIGSINPKWYTARMMSPAERKAWALTLTERPETVEMRRISNYTNVKTTVFDQKFTAEITRKTWWPTHAASRVKIDRQAALKHLVGLETSPAKGSDDFRLLHTMRVNWPEEYGQLKAQKRWGPGIRTQRTEQSAVERLRRMDKIPSQYVNNADYQFWLKWTKDPGIRAVLLRERPDLVPKKST